MHPASGDTRLGFYSAEGEVTTQGRGWAATWAALLIRRRARRTRRGCGVQVRSSPGEIHVQMRSRFR
jgi:hypothetical protein